MRLSDLNCNYISILICLIILLTNCFDKKKDEKELWIGKELILPSITSTDKKIVTRFQGDCPSCIASIDIWRKIVDAIKAKNNRIMVIFYVEIIREETFKELKQKLNFADYVILDQKNSFFKKNLLKFPYGLEDQTFLLDESNKVILFGNPAVKKDLIDIYIKEI
jgi:hypothetical protein